ncbi:hypothetical protein CQ14_03065 [Bradyrhizobium lablabi]|uniref:Uncharacterized protein n=2 Tax=Bradyrhizobium lablabi TaxID=722472 RepID=A0A0R3N2C3_9BRAD|nr:hypothetical protein CQ14_03065 [Bradyrhizobium lablabi]
MAGSQLLPHQGGAYPLHARAEDVREMRRLGARHADMDMAIGRLLDNLGRKGLSAAEISERLRAWAGDLDEMAHEERA